MSPARWLTVCVVSAALAGCQLAEQLVPTEEPTAGSGSTAPVADTAPSPADILGRLDAAALNGSGAVRILNSGVLEVGDTGAPLTLTVFTEYHCRYCYQFQAEMFPNLREEFIDTGRLKVRFIIRPLAKYPNGIPARQALLCAARQNRGWEMHLGLTGQSDRSSAASLAAIIGLDAETFTACQAGDELAGWLERQDAVTEELGVDLLPTFFLNGEKQTGLPSYPDLRGWIAANE
jgi:protein-disulfide isomerase